MYNAPFEIAVRGCGHAVGSIGYSNEDLMEQFDIRIKASFVEKNVGSKTRFFISNDVSTSDLAARAAEKALADANIFIDQIDRLIVATSTGDYLSPSTACVVQQKLGGRGFPAMDVGAACSGFIYGVDQAIRSIATGDNNVLVIGVDVRSRTLNWQNKRTAFLYGDGAGAVVISRQNNSSNGFIASLLYADGAGHDAVYVPSVGLAFEDQPLPSHLTMPNGKRVSENAGRGIPSLCDQLLEKTAFTRSDLDFYLLHQPNLYLLKSVCEEMSISEDQTVINFPRYGNTVAASIPIGMSEAIEQNKIQPGDLVVMCAVGAGFTGGAHLLRWCAPGDFV